MKTNYLCRNCFYYPTLCENGGKQRRGSSYICKYFKLKDERPKGEWLLVGHDDTCNFYRCSFCGYEEHDNFTKHHNFCPNCGADMKGE